MALEFFFIETRSPLVKYHLAKNMRHYSLKGLMYSGRGKNCLREEFWRASTVVSEKRSRKRRRLTVCHLFECTKIRGSHLIPLPLVQPHFVVSSTFCMNFLSASRGGGRNEVRMRFRVSPAFDIIDYRNL